MNHKSHIQLERGITIIELSISVAIIGLLLALISGGLYLLHSAELRRTISDFTSLKSAITEFDNKYNALPGDLSNAESYWGTYTAGVPITGAQNGNGNSLIDEDEDLYSWRHLNLSGLYPGQFTGLAVGDGKRFAPGVNAPPSNVYTSALFRFYDISIPLYGARGHALQLGVPNGSGLPNEGVMKPKDAYAIDSKLDDSNANSGILMGSNGSSSCVDNDGNYALESSNISCILVYWHKLF